MTDGTLLKYQVTKVTYNQAVLELDLVVLWLANLRTLHIIALLCVLERGEERMEDGREGRREGRGR